VAQSPHFKPVIDLVARAAKLSLATRSPISIPPLLLVGAAGIGKSYFVRQLAEMLGKSHVERIAGDMLSDRGALTGLSLAWRGARPGRVATALLEGPAASPIFFLDEVDKICPIHGEEKPLAFLHTVLEPENSSRFQDEYLGFRMRADHVIWLLTANSVESFAPSILDRLTIIHLEAPSTDHVITIVRNMYASMNARLNYSFEEPIRPEVMASLIPSTPRTVQKLLALSFGHAVEHRRWFLTEQDICSARLLLESEVPQKASVGFL
jgi:ATP-dependent Lon protease